MEKKIRVNIENEDIPKEFGVFIKPSTKVIPLNSQTEKKKNQIAFPMWIVLGILIGILLTVSINFVDNYVHPEVSPVGISVFHKGDGVVIVKKGFVVSGDSTAYSETDNGKHFEKEMPEYFVTDRNYKLYTKTIMIVYKLDEDEVTNETKKEKAEFILSIPET